ncbi:MAG: MOSC domain-containing protein [Anaerolineales bacterium]
MTAVTALTAVTGKGFVGDASYGKRKRQVLLIDSETLIDLKLNPGDARENITLVDFELARLSSRDQLMVGEILLAVTGPCAPCKQLDELRPGLRSDIEGRRGVLATVIRGGELKVSDPISLVQGEPAAAAPSGTLSI